MLKSFYKRYGFLQIICLFLSVHACGNGLEENKQVRQNAVQESLSLIDHANIINGNKLWPNLNPGLFVKNLKENVLTPERIYQGKNTYFCGYAAIAYLLVSSDPLTYTRGMLELYEKGFTCIGKTVFKPGKRIREAAGTLSQKKILDSAHADQLLFLCLADEFKCYLNAFNLKYNPGDEDSRWASTSYKKFNRMAKCLLVKAAESEGSDFKKPPLDNLQEYVSGQLDNGGIVVLFVNRRIKERNPDGIKLWLPRHYIVVKKINSENSDLSIKFWDYGSIKEKKISKSKFRKTVYGISTFYLVSSREEESITGVN